MSAIREASPVASVAGCLFVAAAFSALPAADLAWGQNAGTRVEPWVVRFQLMRDSVHDTPYRDTDGAWKFRDGVSFPVAPGLYQWLKPDSLVALVSVFTMRDAEASITSVMNSSEDVYVDTYADTWWIKVDIPDGRFKVVLWPDPSLWSPGSAAREHAVAVEDSFEITGVLHLMDGGEVVSFPPEARRENLIRFERVKAVGAQDALGFSAFVDCEVRGGKLVNRALVLAIDRDGDGVEDQKISGGPYVSRTREK
jgi:hypothetical protein